MMAKIVKGNSFRNCVNYVTRASKDNPDGTPSDEWKLIACSDILAAADREEIIRTFEDNRSLRPEIKKPVGLEKSVHIAPCRREKIDPLVKISLPP